MNPEMKTTMTTEVEIGESMQHIEDHRLDEVVVVLQWCNPNDGASAAADRQLERSAASGGGGGGDAVVVRGVRDEEAQVAVQGARGLAAAPRGVPAKLPDVRAAQRHQRVDRQHPRRRGERGEHRR